jgi:hypothetical protein
MDGLVELELKRVRGLAAQWGNSVLLYFIDMAILEAQKEAQAFEQDSATSLKGSSKYNRGVPAE